MRFLLIILINNEYCIFSKVYFSMYSLSIIPINVIFSPSNIFVIFISEKKDKKKVKGGGERGRFRHLSIKQITYMEWGKQPKEGLSVTRIFKFQHPYFCLKINIKYELCSELGLMQF